MNLTLPLIAIAAAASTLLGGLFALRFKDRLHLITAFSAGAVLGVTLFDLLPEALNLNPDQTHQTVLLFTALGFFAYATLNQWLAMRPQNEECCDNQHHKGGLGAGSLTLHSVLDGMAIGLSFQVSTIAGLIVAIAVLAHDFADGINTVSMVLRHQGKQLSALRWLFLDAAAPVVGIIIGSFLTVSSSTLGYLLATFAGLFLFIGASDLLPEAHHNHPQITTALATLLGAGSIYLIIRIAGA